MALFRRRRPDHEAAPPASSQHDDPWARAQALTALHPSTLSTNARHLVALAGLRTEVNNGGFDQYFFNSGGDLALDALAASQALGIDELTRVIQQALDQFGDGYTTDRDSRQVALELLHDDAFESLDDAFYALEGSVDLDAAMTVLAQAVE